MIHPLSQNDLTSFFNSFDLIGESIHIQELVHILAETATCYQNIIHAGFIGTLPFGFISLKITNDVDNISGLLIEFLYVKSEYRYKLVPLAIDTNAKWLDKKYISWENLLHEEMANNECTEIF